MTQAGLILGNSLMGGDAKIHGIMVDQRFQQEQQEDNVLTAVKAAATLFNTDLTLEASAVACIAGYNDDLSMTKRATDTIKLVAQTEGIFLDPVYTGRVMAAMIDQIRAGRIPPQDSVVFYHSGGIPEIFSHSNALLS